MFKNNNLKAVHQVCSSTTCVFVLNDVFPDRLPSDFEQPKHYKHVFVGTNRLPDNLPAYFEVLEHSEDIYCFVFGGGGIVGQLSVWL